jgi:hypothetical protein
MILSAVPAVMIVFELPIYHFGCNMEEEAFKLLNERILKDVK